MKAAQLPDLLPWQIKALADIGGVEVAAFALYIRGADGRTAGLLLQEAGIDAVDVEHGLLAFLEATDFDPDA